MGGVFLAILLSQGLFLYLRYSFSESASEIGDSQNESCQSCLVLLFCPFLFVFTISSNSCSHDCCPFCDEKKGEDQTKCKSCGFEFWRNRVMGWLLAGGALLCVLSLVLWIESKVSLGTYYLRGDVHLPFGTSLILNKFVTAFMQNTNFFKPQFFMEFFRTRIR